jgi:hypothetical protein
MTGSNGPAVVAIILSSPIVHELLHFYVPNHGKLWKSLMRAHLGEYEHAESELRTKAAMLSGQRRRPP